MDGAVLGDHLVVFPDQRGFLLCSDFFGQCAGAALARAVDVAAGGIGDDRDYGFGGDGDPDFYRWDLVGDYLVALLRGYAGKRLGRQYPPLFARVDFPARQ